MAKDIFDTILDKDYYQLTSNELTEIAEFCKNEEEFLAMKQVLAHSKTIAEGPKLSPKEETKEKLDILFDSTYGKRKKIIPFYLNPIIQIAAVVVVGFAVWMFVSKSRHLETVQMAENASPKKQENNPEEKLIQKNNQIKEDKNIDIKNLSAHTYDGRELKSETLLENNTQVKIAESSKQHDYNSYDSEEKAFSNDDFSRRMMEKKVNEIEIAKTDSDVDDTKETAMTLSHKKTEKTFSKVSTPATSVKDISVEASKSPYKNQVVTSMNVSEQKNVMNYLVAKY